MTDPMDILEFSGNNGDDDLDEEELDLDESEVDDDQETDTDGAEDDADDAKAEKSDQDDAGDGAEDDGAGDDQDGDGDDKGDDDAKAKAAGLEKALVAERQRRITAEGEAARLKKLAEDGEFKPELFADQAELDKFDGLDSEGLADLPDEQRKRYRDLVAAKTRHDIDQERKAEAHHNEAAQHEADKATVMASIEQFKEDNPDLAPAFDHAENLSQADLAAIWKSKEGAGKVMYDLLVKRTPELRSKSDSSSSQSSETNENKGAAKPETNTEPDDGDESDDESGDFISMLAGGDDEK